MEREEAQVGRRRPDRRACSAMMYTKDQPNIFINECDVHKRLQGYEEAERAEKERQERSASLPSADISIIEELFVNRKMKSKLTQANIDPYSSEGRSEIYCRFVLEHPHHRVSHTDLLTS